MLVKVTKDQLVSTDDILFAEADDLDDEKTRVWLRHFPNPITVDVDFDQFVYNINHKVAYPQTSGFIRA